MSLAQLIDEYGFGICIGVGLLDILAIIALVLVLALICMIVYFAIYKTIEHDFDISFDELAYIQKHYYELETKVSELKCRQLSCKDVDKNGRNNGTKRSLE